MLCFGCSLLQSNIIQDLGSNVLIKYLLFTELPAWLEKQLFSCKEQNKFVEAIKSFRLRVKQLSERLAVDKPLLQKGDLKYIIDTIGKENIISQVDVYPLCMAFNEMQRLVPLKDVIVDDDLKALYTFFTWIDTILGDFIIKIEKMNKELKETNKCIGKITYFQMEIK